MLSPCVVTLVLIIAATSEASIETQPLNAAVNIGEKGIFSCTSNVSALPTWRYKVSAGDAPTLITDIGTCISLISSRYSTESTGPGNCNLIVLNATISDALIYNCIDSKLAEKEAVLIVIESVSVSTTTDEPLLEEAVNITCSVKYAAPNPPPNLYPEILWTNSSSSINMTGTVLTPTPPSNIVTSYVNLTAYPPTVESYWCNVYFKPPTNLIGTNSATNAPSYYRTTKSTEMSILYNGTSTITETPYNESGICEAKILDCSYNAYPPPHDIHWIDIHRNESMPTNKTQITAEYGGEYVCSVTNVIKGANHTSNTNFTLDNSGNLTATPCKGVSEINATASQSNDSSVTYEIVSRNKISLIDSSTFNSRNSGNSTDVNIICITDGIPNATITWTNPCGDSTILTNDTQHIVATMSGNYICSAYNTINDRNFTANVTIRIGGLPDASKVCKSLTSESPSQTTNANTSTIVVTVLVSYFGLNILLLCIFLLIYGCSKTYREDINRKFHWIGRALSCINNNGCSCSWELVLFILCSVLVGIIFIPYVLIASKCCQKDPKKSQEDSVDLPLPARNPSTNENSHENGGQHPRTSYSTGGQIPLYRPPPAPKRSPSRGAGYPNSHQDFPHSTPNYRPPGPSTTVSPEGILYQELRIDSKPGSRKPVDLINAGNGGVYADLHST